MHRFLSLERTGFWGHALGPEPGDGFSEALLEVTLRQA
jgi:hypothetical protein